LIYADGNVRGDLVSGISTVATNAIISALATTSTYGHNSSR
jgi:hypothetical protein